MGHTAILTTNYAPLLTVGIVLVIMWAMNNAGSHRKGSGQDQSAQIHPREV